MWTRRAVSKPRAPEAVVRVYLRNPLDERRNLQEAQNNQTKVTTPLVSTESGEEVPFTRFFDLGEKQLSMFEKGCGLGQLARSKEGEEVVAAVPFDERDKATRIAIIDLDAYRKDFSDNNDGPELDS